MESGNLFRDQGINQAVRHADEVIESWSDKASRFFEAYATTHHTFSGEEVRTASRGIVEAPPSLRAWGGVLMGAAKRGIIERAGYIQVKNPNAHCANASLWRSRICCRE